MREKKRQYISTILLILYMFFFASANLQQHTHIVDGITIVHSHFSKDSLPFTSHKTKHSHNTTEINLIHNLNTAIFFILFISIILGEIIPKLKRIIKEKENAIPIKSYLYSPYLRGPPIS